MKNRNQELIVLVGPPGSGKTTFAKYHVRTEENWFRVSRDDFRTMQFSTGNLSVEDEKRLTKIVSSSVHGALKAKMNVIIDATHTRKEFLNSVIREYRGRADIHFKLFDYPLNELKSRCAKRYYETGKHIPEHVLKKMYSNFQKIKESFDFSPRLMRKKKVSYNIQSDQLPKAIICDLDGTLCLMNGRNPFDASRCLQDLPNKPVVNMVKNYSELGYEIILLSGRSDEFKPQTIQWLTNNNIDYNMLIMREKGDFRKDSEVKEEFFMSNIHGKYNVELVLDDRDQVVELWREKLMLPCFQVYYGDF